MIKFNDLKIGDYVMGEFEGKLWEGEVVRLNNEDKQVCVETDVQEFWFEPEHLFPIPLNDESLRKLGFEQDAQEDGTVKYKKASFRLVVPAKDDFSHIDMWYREDRRHHPDIHYVHQLQNAHLQMTKIHLTREPV
jgi:hypothetical protein